MVIDQMLQIPPNGYPTAEQNLQSHQIQKAKTTNNLLLPGKFRSVRFVQISEFQEKTGISELSGFQEFRNKRSREFWFKMAE